MWLWYKVEKTWSPCDCANQNCEMACLLLFPHCESLQLQQQAIANEKLCWACLRAHDQVQDCVWWSRIQAGRRPAICTKICRASNHASGWTCCKSKVARYNESMICIQAIADATQAWDPPVEEECWSYLIFKTSDLFSKQMAWLLHSLLQICGCNVQKHSMI